VQVAFAQDFQSDSQLALQYYKDKEYDKAAPLYLKLWQQSSIRTYMQYYVLCMAELKQFEEAEKFIRKEIRSDKSEATNYVELGYVFKLQNKLKDSDEAYSQAIAILNNDQNSYINLANIFMSRREYDYAEKTFLDARKKFSYGFQFELAWVYQQKGKYDQMINEYLNLIEINDAYIQSVQNRLQATVYNDTEGSLQEMLKKALLVRIQKRPDKVIFVEMLIWIYLQERDYEKALLQARALDKRSDNGSKRIFEIGLQAAESDHFTAARDAYTYIIKKGNLDAYYMDASSEYLSVMYRQVVSVPSPERLTLEELEKKLTDAITELGINKSTFQILLKRATLLGFYMGRSEEARKLLDEVAASGRISSQQAAEARILLGDLYLFEKDIWEATLIYARVEKDFPNDPIGHDARFKKARLAYYSGDFRWAEAQLSVLKGATSKLIANDAFGMSLLIKDNLVDDSEGDALKILSRAEWLHYRKEDSLAIITLDSIVKRYPQNVIADDALFLKARYLEGMGRHEQAVAIYEKVYTGFPYDILADDALYAAAKLQLNSIDMPEAARDLFKQFIVNYPGSIFITEVRRLYRELRDKYPEPKMLKDEPQP
jgi:tetratricopeptide (TPR) repeat protein